jgi:predicted peptidase
MAKKSMIARLVNIALFAALIFLGYNEYAHLRLKAPMYNKTALFQKKYHFTTRPPFIDAYYLLVPPDYQPKYKYPLVLVLPDGAGHVYAAYALADDELRKSFHAFVLVPFTSARSFWAAPANPASRPPSPGLHLPDALPQAIEMIHEVRTAYTIDPDRLYVTGYGAGGMAAYGAAARYPGKFAAVLPVEGQWDPAEAPLLKQTPVWAFHGATDKAIPPGADRLLDKAVRKAGGHMTYTEIPDMGADVWKRVYGEPGVWFWLFQRRLHGAPPAPAKMDKHARKPHK